MSSDMVQMDSPVEGLHASAPETLPFAPDIDIRAFLLPRSRGNLLIYSVSEFDTDAAGVADLGGVARQYLNHWHEALFTAKAVSAPLFVHAADRAEAEDRGRHARGTFSRRHMLDEDFEVIPTPGHTPGATAYLWDSGRHRFLFTGDSIYLENGEWVEGLLESSDRAAMIESFELIRELEFDVLVPWAATRGGPFVTMTDRADTRRRMDAMLGRLRSEGAG